MIIETIWNEARRGCGYRSGGGTYMITDGQEITE